MAEVDSLSIKISASSTEAASAIGELATQLGRLKEQFKGGMGSSQFKTLITNLTDLAKVAKEMDGSMASLSKAAKAVERLSAIGKVRIPKSIGDGIRNVGLAAEMVTPQAVENLDNMTRSLQRLANVDLRGVASALRGIRNNASSTPASATRAKQTVQLAPANIMGALFDKDNGGALSGFGKFAFEGITTGLKKVISLAKEAGRWLKKLGQRIVVNIKANTVDRLRDKLKGVQNIFRSLGRIAYYRLIRSAIKAVTQAFSEGLKNAYLFSEGLSNAVDGRIAVALDALTSSALKMKNQLGAAFGSLLTAIAPVLQTIIAMVTNLANAITQLLAAFTGATFLRAKDVSAKFSDDMAKGAGSAKEWKNQLMGFDVINRLEEPSKGGGGSAATELNPADMFEVTEINTAIRNFVEDFKAAINAGKWREAGELLGNKINGVVKMVKWEEIGMKLGRAFGGAISVMYNALKTTDFIVLGNNVAKLINNALAQINFDDLGAFLVTRFTSALDFFGGMLGHISWGSVGLAIGNFLRGALNSATTWFTETDWEVVANTIKTGVSDFIKKLDPGSIVDSLGALFRAAFSALFTIVETIFPDGIIPALTDAIINVVTKAVAFIKTDDFKASANVLRYKVTKALFGEEFANLRFQQIGDYAGKDIVLGLINGIESKENELVDAVKTDMTDPLIESAKTNLDEHSPSKVFEDIGKNVIQGFLDGMKGLWGSVTQWFNDVFGNIITWCQDAHAWIQNVFDGLNLLKSGSILSWAGSKISGIMGRASGGYVPNGQLFLAREAGPELVGSIGNQTAVANNQQIIEGIKEGVFEAVVSAMGGMNGGDREVAIYLDGREIARSTTRYQTQMARAGAY